MMRAAAHKWMNMALYLAGAYNLIWGALAVLFPSAMLERLGLGAIDYPELWQGIGMIVWVYGIGYAIAGTSPLRHWPIVLVGLLGKILGPIGFLNAWLHGRFPLSFGAMLLTNDLIWWIPFALILRQAYQEHVAQQRRKSPEVLDLAFRARTEDGQSLSSLSRQAPLLLLFLRHSGCPFCKEALADLARQRHQIEKLGIEIVLVHMGSSDQGYEMAARFGLGDLRRLSDPDQTIYRAFGLARGTFAQLFGPSTLLRGLQVLWKGHRVGRIIGDVLQMPGVFLLFHGEVIRSFRHQSLSDRPDFAEFTNFAADSEHLPF